MTVNVTVIAVNVVSPERLSAYCPSIIADEMPRRKPIEMDRILFSGDTRCGSVVIISWSKSHYGWREARDTFFGSY